MGAHSTFTQEAADRICERLEAGESLRKAAKAEGTTAATVLRWKDQFPEFSKQYARAREIGYNLLADELLEISDDGAGDYEDTERGPVAKPEVVARARLRVDTRKWMLAKMLPKVYGEKLELGSDPDKPLVHKIVREVVKPA